jgi:hypothetical protein
VRRAGALTVATLVTAVLLAACGGSSAGLIPTNNAITIANDLSSLSSALGSYSCGGTQTALASLATDINNLPASVAAKLRNNLLTGYESLDNTARTQCHLPAGSHSHSTSPTGPTGTSHTTGASTSPSGTTTSPSGTTTSPSGTTTGPSGVSGPSIGPGGGSQAPTGNSGTTGDSNGGAVSGT